MTLKNALLGVSLLSFVIGFSELQENVVFWMGRPVGAIFFILYFILLVLEKEYAATDTENAPSTAKRGSSAKISPNKAPAPALSTPTR